MALTILVALCTTIDRTKYHCVLLYMLNLDIAKACILVNCSAKIAKLVHLTLYIGILSQGFAIESALHDADALTPTFTTLIGIYWGYLMSPTPLQTFFLLAMLSCNRP